MVFIVLATLGAAVGSFLSVLIERLEREDGIVAGRSRCPVCRQQLAWYDLIPLVSFVLLGGRCRFCRRPISFFYPFLEVASAALAVLWYRQYGPDVTGHEGVLLVLVFGFLALAVYDLRRFMLPDTILLVLGLAIVLPAWNSGNLSGVLLSAFLASLVFAILYLASRGRWIGLGDVKLAALIGGAFFYSETIVILFAAVWSAALVGVSMILTGRATTKTPLPFGAFLSGAAVIVILFAHELRFLTGLIPRIF